MRKNFLVGVVAFFLFLGGANALTFEGKAGMYVLEEVETKCDISKMWVFGITEKNELVLEDNVTGDLVKLANDKTCQKLTAQQILDFNNYTEKLMHTEYFIEQKTNGDIVIMKQENAMFFEEYVRTEDTKVTIGKTYYHDNDSNNIFEEVTSPVDAEIGTYYEKINLKNPTTINLTEGPYYQYVNGGSGVEKVINPNVDDIEFYFIKATNFNSETSEVAKLNKKIFKPLLDANPGKVSVMENNGELYISIEDDSQYPKYLADHYTLDGKKIASGVSVAFEMNQSLIAKYDHDLIETNIYDFQDKLVYQHSGLLWEYLYEDNVSYLFSENNETKIYELRYYAIIEGANSTYEGKELKIKTTGQISQFDKLLINGKEVASSNYKLDSGSTIITLKNDYLKSLKEGKYTLEIMYKDGGIVKTTMSVPINNPQTFDGITFYIILFFMSLIGCVVTNYYLKNKIKVTN